MRELTRREVLTKSAQCAMGLAGFVAGSGCGGGSGSAGASNTVLSATETTGLNGIAAAFMTKYKSPGISVAISINQRLGYTYGFGTANPTSGALVSPASMFRIASSSKPFTAVTCIRLINAGKLQLVDKVFGPNSLLGNVYPDYQYDTGGWVQQITVEHLLTHTAGGWFETNPAGSAFTDPVWDNENLSQSEMIAYTLEKVPLQHQPGTWYGYSNFGYVLLARIIAKITGLTYSQGVYQQVLTPCGITNMQLASDKALPNEVSYYDPKLSKTPGSWVARIDGAGGWVATATDLVHFLTHVDGYASVDGLVPSQGATVTMQTMTTPHGGTQDLDPYGMGWQLVSSNQWGHNGGQHGVSSEVMRVQDSAGNIYCVAVQLNTSDDGTLGFSSYLPMISAMVGQLRLSRSNLV